MNKSNLRTLFGLVGLAIGVLAWTGLAHAGAVYRGSIDPPRFIGDFEIEVPDACILADGWIQAGPGSGSCGVVDFLGGTLTDPGGSGDTIVFPSNPLIDLTIGLFWSGGSLGGIDAIFGPGNSYLPGPFPYAGIGYFLVFTSGHFDNLSLNVQASGGLNPTVTLYCINSIFDDDFSRVHSKTHPTPTTYPCTANLGGEAAGITFTQVPEPGTLLLLAAAFVAGGIGARRNTRTD